MDFEYVKTASKDEQIRAFAVEKAIEIFRSSDTPPNGPMVTGLAAKIEDYIKNGNSQ